MKANLKLNPNKEVVPEWDNDKNVSRKIKAAYKISVDGAVKKIGSTEQSPKQCVLAFKNGQKGGNPSVTTANVSAEVQKALLSGSEVIIEFIQVKDKKTPKDLRDKIIKEYKKENNGMAPEWNKQSNKEKWRQHKEKEE